MKVDNFVSNRLKNYIWYISVTTRPPQVCIPGYAPDLEVCLIATQINCLHQWSKIALMHIISNILSETIEKIRDFIVAAQNMIIDPLFTKNLNVFGCVHKSIEEHNVRCEIRFYTFTALFIGNKISQDWSSFMSIKRGGISSEALPVKTVMW